MMDAEDAIRAAAAKLAKQYRLPTHIVEEELVGELKPFIRGHDEASKPIAVLVRFYSHAAEAVIDPEVFINGTKSSAEVKSSPCNSGLIEKNEIEIKIPSN